MARERHTQEELAEVLAAIDGYEDVLDVELSADKEYFKLLIFNRIPVLADSADSDLYDVDSAIGKIEDYIYENKGILDSEPLMNTIRVAYNMGMDKNPYDLEQEYINASDFIYMNTPEEDYVYARAELNTSGRGQSYTNSYSNTVSGEIFDFGKYRADKHVYFIDTPAEGNWVSYYELPSIDDEAIHDYGFCFDRDVYDGEVVVYYDYF